MISLYFNKLLFLFNRSTLILGKRSWKTTDNIKIVLSYNFSFYWHIKNASKGLGFNSFLMGINTNFKSTLVVWQRMTEIHLKQSLKNQPLAKYTECAIKK